MGGARPRRPRSAGEIGDRLEGAVLDGGETV
jgi:hypothetical protein